MRDECISKRTVVHNLYAVFNQQVLSWSDDSHSLVVVAAVKEVQLNAMGKLSDMQADLMEDLYVLGMTQVPLKLLSNHHSDNAETYTNTTSSPASFYSYTLHLPSPFSFLHYLTIHCKHQSCSKSCIRRSPSFSTRPPHSLP